jgi:quercetin dioxygenase-like cupin family protein
MATRPVTAADSAFVPIGEQEPILRGDGREISLLVADEDFSLTHATRPAGERVTGPHVHRHTEAFYVLEGELTFEVGAEGEKITVGAGGFVAVPPRVVHSFGTDGHRQARWLVIHARDGGFAAFMRGMRDGVAIEWDIAPGDGGLPADRAIVSRSSSAPPSC